MNCKLYYQTTGTRQAWPGTGSAPNLTEVTNVRDATLNLEKGEADTTTRGNSGWRSTEGTLKDGSVEFEMVWDTSDAAFTAIKDAYFNDTTIALAALTGDKDTAGSQGIWADFSITNFSQTQGLEDAVIVSVSAKPAYSAVATQWVTVAT
jgi:hypothetical protein